MSNNQTTDPTHRIGLKNFMIMTYSGQQLQKILNISKPTVKFRAEKLGIKKHGFQWRFTESEVDRMRAYKYIRSPHFYFTEDGEYLLIESKLNSNN